MANRNCAVRLRGIRAVKNKATLPDLFEILLRQFFLCFIGRCMPVRIRGYRWVCFRLVENKGGGQTQRYPLMPFCCPSNWRIPKKNVFRKPENLFSSLWLQHFETLTLGVLSHFPSQTTSKPLPIRANQNMWILHSTEFTMKPVGESSDRKTHRIWDFRWFFRFLWTICDGQPLSKRNANSFHIFPTKNQNLKYF